MPQVDVALPEGVPAELVELIELAPLPGLDGGPRCPATAKRIRELLKFRSELSGTLTEAALWLLAGELDRSHAVSQEAHSAEGSFWHGIMHRREGDFWNSKYWFRRVGKHPVFEQLAGHIASDSTFGDRQFGSNGLPMAELSNAAKLPAALVDECERALASKADHTGLLQRICWLEWQFLFHYGWD